MKTLFPSIWFFFASISCFAQEATTPDYLPNIADGEKLYQGNCSSCHGSKGMADTTFASTLKKRPAAIGDPKVLSRLSPGRVYEVVTSGFPESGMPSFKHLTEKDRWDLAAYIFLLNCNFQKPEADARPSLDWSETRNQTDFQIIETLRKRGVPEKYIQNELFAARYLLE